MYSYISNSNIISRKNLINFLRLFFPYIHLDLRCEQFINIKILKEFTDIIEYACIAANYRGGKILQSKDIRFVFLQEKQEIFPKLNFLNKYSYKIKKKTKNFKNKILNINNTKKI
nr:transcription initiation factor TFIID subunit [Cryptomonas curvata]